MKRLRANNDGWYCGWWNDSPIQINFAERRSVYKNETLHYHRDFYEYYLVVQGYLVIEVNGQRHRVDEGEMMVVEPGEHHEVVDVSKAGCRYVTVKSKSYAGNKVRAAREARAGTRREQSRESRVAK